MLEQQIRGKIRGGWLEDIISKAKSGEFTEGVYYTPLNAEGFSIVVGWESGYDTEEDLIQQGGYTLCGKVAYNCDDLQCDYDMDWYMPSDKHGDIADTSMAIRSAEDMKWFEEQLEETTDLFKRGELVKG